MISVRKISKIYNSDKTPVYALRNVTLSFPSKGMVFVVGKSGSGKSTLLNVLAGFDRPTRGNVHYGDTNLNNLSSTEIDFYRNSVIGFIFQDYCLIETFTVKQNIEVAFDYKKEKASNEKIDEILTSVGLKGFENRYPKQLSAGQKQRVAIARALAKNSKIILADEPTGNLDSKTTTQILDLLKEISQERLVVVVSHSKEDAHTYADRIIEIANGQIIKDQTKNKMFKNSFEVNDNVITLPNKERLEESHIMKINELIKKEKGNVVFKKGDEQFLPYNEKEKLINIPIKKTFMGLKNLFKYSWLFFKNQLFSFFLIVFIVTMLITTLTLSIQFGTYNGERQYTDAILSSDTKTMAIYQYEPFETKKSPSTSKYLFEFNEEKGNLLKEEFDYKSYDLYNYNLPISTSYAVHYIQRDGITLYGINNLLVCDEEYLTSTFAHDDGELRYYGDISSSADGIIITDFVADYIIASRGLSYKIYSYEEMLETTYFMKTYGVKISAIIDTPFSYEEYKKGEMIKHFNTEMDLYDAIKRDYLIGYTTNKDYYPSYVEKVANTVTNFSVPTQSVSTIDGKEEYLLYENIFYFSKTLKENQITLSYTAYNDLFNTNCSASNKEGFEQKEVTFRTYDVKNKKITENNFTVTSLSTYTYIPVFLRETIVKDAFYKTAEYSVEIEDKSKFHNAAIDNGFYFVSTRTSAVEAIVNCISIFKDMFKMLSVIMIISIIVLIIVNTVNIMNRNIYNIGVSRSLGAHLGELGFIYSFQMVLFGVLVIIFSLISTFFSLRFINNVLSTSIPKVIELTGVVEITYVYFNPYLSSLITGMVVFLTIVSIFIPILTIRLMNPVNIIKQKS